MKLTPRPYQTALIEAIRSEYRAGRRAPLLQSATGSGKTVMFSVITEGASQRGKSVWILVHRQELLRQSSDSLSDIGIHHGIIAPGYSMTRDRVQVASVQTVVRRLGKLPAPDLIVIDEAHHANAGSYRTILSACPQARLLGVTATPTRLDGTGLGVDSGGVFDAIVLGPSVSALVDQGFLSKPVVYAPPLAADLSKVRHRGKEYERSSAAGAMDKPRITGDAVAHYRRLCAGRPAIAFCVSVAHAEHVRDTFRSAGIQAESIDGSTADDQRRQLIADLGTGRLQVLTSCDLIGEGVDVPVVEAAILLRPTESVGLYLQQVGRAMRVAPGKSRALILDHVGNVERHGMPDDDRDWSLDGKRQGQRKGDGDDACATAPHRMCPACYAMSSVKEPRCSECGAAWPTRALPQQTDGELVEVDDAARAALSRRMKSEVAQARTLEELEELAKRRGYARGWAKYVFRARMSKQQRYGT